jgi:hypothetical protein
VILQELVPRLQAQIIKADREIAEAQREYEIFLQDTSAVDDEVEIIQETRALEKDRIKFQRQIQEAEFKKKLAELQESPDEHEPSTKRSKPIDHDIFDDEK